MLCSGEDSVKWVRVAVEPRCGPGERNLCQDGAWFWLWPATTKGRRVRRQPPNACGEKIDRVAGELTTCNGVDTNVSRPANPPLGSRKYGKVVVSLRVTDYTNRVPTDAESSGEPGVVVALWSAAPICDTVDATQRC